MAETNKAPIYTAVEFWNNAINMASWQVTWLQELSWTSLAPSGEFYEVYLTCMAFRLFILLLSWGECLFYHFFPGLIREKKLGSLFCARQHEDPYECLFKSLTSFCDVGPRRGGGGCCPSCPQMLSTETSPETWWRVLPIRNTAQTLQVPNFTSSHQRKSILEEIVSEVIVRRVLRLSGNQTVALRRKLLPPSSGYKINPLGPGLSSSHAVSQSILASSHSRPTTACF